MISSQSGAMELLAARRIGHAERQIAVSNIYMTRPNRWFVETSILLFSSSLVFAISSWGQAPAMPATPPVLVFEALPSRQLLARGEAVVVVLIIRNLSEGSVFVSRLTSDEFVDFSVIGSDGKEVPWRGKRRIDSKGYAPSDFVVLGRYQEISSRKIISLNDGAGSVFDKPGQYSVTAEYSLPPPERFAPFAGESKIPTGSFRSGKAAFCIEACIPGPAPGQNRALVSEPRVHSDVPQSALDAVRVFYIHIARYRPLGIPQGRAKKALWPLLSKRLVGELDSLQACEDDYYRRYGEILRANQFKPATPWLEVGLFSGPIEAAAPTRFSILSSRAIGENRVDVHLSFSNSVSHDHFEGVVTAILEKNRWVIDDFVAMYVNDELLRLSDGNPVCKGHQWVGQPPY